MTQQQYGSASLRRMPVPSGSASPLIRRLAEPDIPEACAIIAAAFTQNGILPDRYGPARVALRLHASTGAYESLPRFLVASAPDDPTRLLAVAGYGRVEFAAKTWSLFLAATRPDLQRTGLGRHLILARLAKIRIGLAGTPGRVMVNTRHPHRFAPYGFVTLASDAVGGTALMVRHVPAWEGEE